ncbi:hypothetical protein HPB48_026562 [Haemaphysalis longicornis]|uniref:Uncharacterized protein n=1 Tax=Haemaphysalis longicornis TaxID=44386 RepID=A0A9J6HBR9_HAELO|nr:hypothetical protein HPB48_026562 [Haemaphysalis longicornis]
MREPFPRILQAEVPKMGKKKALKRERDEKEEAQKEVKRLAEELEEAKAINERLTVALLDKIEIARDEARKLRPDPRGEVIAEFILPPPPGAANGDGPGQDLVGQYPEDDCIIPGYQGPAATSEDREVADQDDDIIPADQLPAEMAEECEVADCLLPDVGYVEVTELSINYAPLQRNMELSFTARVKKTLRHAPWFVIRVQHPPYYRDLCLDKGSIW